MRRLSQAAEKLDLYTKCRWNPPYGADIKTGLGCSKRPSSKAAVSEEARHTLRYVEPLSDARMPLADFFSILLATSPQETIRRVVIHQSGGLHIGIHDRAADKAKAAFLQILRQCVAF